MAERRDQAAKTHQQLAPISNAEIKCRTATATHFPMGQIKKTKNKSEGERCFLELLRFLRLHFNVQDSVPFLALCGN